MAYHFKRDESVPDAIRRIACEELESTVGQLQDPPGGSLDEAIHEARKSVKKVRALLRLVQVEMGDSYRTESSGLRQMGQKLSELRDAGAVIEIFDKLKERFPDQFAGRKLDSIRRGLMARKEHAGQAADVAKILRGMAVSLKPAAKRVKTWPIQAGGFSAIGPGLEGAFRKGRQAFALAQQRPRPENYHEWRKRVKDHWYHVRLLEDLWTEVLLGYENSLKDLETWLGDDHNLVLLRERLVAEPESYGKEAAIDRGLRLIDKYQKELRDNAVSLGKRIYQEKPKQVTRRLRQLWEEWKTEPKSLEALEKERRRTAHAASP